MLECLQHHIEVSQLLWPAFQKRKAGQKHLNNVQLRLCNFADSSIKGENQKY